MKNSAKTISITASLSALMMVHSSAFGSEISNNEVTIGAMVDMSGVYSENGGMGAVRAVEMAIDEFRGTVAGVPIRLISADYQNRVDVANTTARQWIDVENVDMIIESTDSASAIGIFGLGEERNVLTIAAGSATTALTNQNCSPLGIHYVYDTYALAVGTGTAIVQEGLDTWFFITADYAFGHSLEENTANVVRELGGNVLGTIRHPLGASDFASFLLQAQSSGADVIGLANAGTDFSNSVRQAGEFGIVEMGQIVAGMLVFLTDIRALSLETAQGLNFTTGFYWDYNESTREFSQRFMEKHGAMPTMIQAGAYSATMHYLNAIEAIRTDEPNAVRAWMGENKVNDFFATDGYIRDDGRFMHTMYLAEVKAPDESEHEWDMVRIIREIPAEDAFMPLEDSQCKLIQ